MSDDPLQAEETLQAEEPSLQDDADGVARVESEPNTSHFNESISSFLDHQQSERPSKLAKTCDIFATGKEKKPRQELVWGHLGSLNKEYPNLELRGDEISFGRGATCTFHFEPKKISLRHCRVWRQNNEGCAVYVQDVSRNGTYVNNIKLGKGSIVRLKPGDKLTIYKSSSESGRIHYLFSFVRNRIVCIEPPFAMELDLEAVDRPVGALDIEYILQQICCLLDDFSIVLFARVSRLWRRAAAYYLRPVDPRFLYMDEYAARIGRMELVEWSWAENFQPGPDMCVIAVDTGNFPLLKMAIARGCSTARIGERSAAHGRLHMLQWSLESKHITTEDQSVLKSATLSGHLDVILWARGNKFAHEIDVLTGLARAAGRPDIVQWLRPA